ncbi:MULTISPECIES: hypothetical protein [Niallia]|uniref:Uncharacterized protein n=1 Tax=Niallia circulans TaxID=1397 RepID=A0A941GDI4_NIACI|nr:MULTISPECIES: hypothetical protein [Niallia]MCB5237203.1 hypothetical protein [Niallia circulans]MED3795633.1 hypothetical protein [Niallia alba]
MIIFLLICVISLMFVIDYLQRNITELKKEQRRDSLEHRKIQQFINGSNGTEIRERSEMKNGQLKGYSNKSSYETNKNSNEFFNNNFYFENGNVLREMIENSNESSSSSDYTDNNSYDYSSSDYSNDSSSDSSSSFD